MTESASDLKARLIRRAGLTDSAVSAAWPDWWSDEAEDSPSAQAELRFSLARKLGLDPRSLVSDEEPRFIWDDSARFKGFSGDPDRERPVISSFGTALSRMLVEATPSAADISGLSATRLRNLILAERPVVGLVELLMTAWSIGVPTIHLRVYPLAAKRMSAMSICVGGRYAVLVARDATYPAPVAFHVAHELGHICLGHLPEGRAIIDLENVEGPVTTGDDPEERAADAFAMEVLTGSSRPNIVVEGTGRNARELAAQAQRVGYEQRIEPGTLALAYGYTTGNWATANAALAHIYQQPFDAWRAINLVASREIAWSSLSDESESFVRAVMGAIDGR